MMGYEIEYAKILSLEGNSLRLRLRTGECLVAPICTSGPGTSFPSKTWINKNKDSFLAVVMYDKGLYTKPFVNGFIPLEGASTDNFDTLNKITELLESLVDILSKAKVNTMLGAQPFLPDTLMAIKEASSKLAELKKDIHER